MPTYRVTVINEHFSQSGEFEAADASKAWQHAVSSALSIGSDQVSHGAPFFGAEVRLEDGDRLIGRYVVSVGASALKE